MVRDYWQKFRDRTAGYKNLAIAASAIAVAISVAVYGILPPINVNLQTPPLTQADASALSGWAGPEVAAQALAEVQARGALSPFVIRGAAEDNAKKRVVLWDASTAILGEHLPTFRQVVGDCVGAGAAQAVNYLQLSQMYIRGPPYDRGGFRAVYEPYHYACGRNAPECGDGRLNRGREPWSGSVGSWQAEALRLYGVIPADEPGLDEYGPSVIKRWAVRMPDRRWIDIGRLHLVKTIAQVTNADQIRDAICNGYAVTIASDWGGDMRPRTIDGRLVNRRSGSWAHQMCVIGYDGATGREPYWYILNSWGPDAHGTPPDGAPPGGFWVTRRDIDYIARQGDSFALSNHDGFEAADWVIIRAARSGIPEPSDN